MKDTNKLRLIMDAVILSAGSGKRMGKLTEGIPKTLLKIGKSTLLSRLIDQLIHHGIDKVYVITGFASSRTEEELKKYPRHKVVAINNSKYEQDTNIYSTYLALNHVQKELLLFEGDLILDDNAVAKIIESAAQGRSLWYTRGPFRSNMSGGILECDNVIQKITDIRIVDRYTDIFSSYKKLLGVMYINTKHIKVFLQKLEEYMKESLKQYYLIPWINNLDELESFCFDLENHLVRTFNTSKEYYDALRDFQ